MSDEETLDSNETRSIYSASTIGSLHDFIEDEVEACATHMQTLPIVLQQLISSYLYPCPGNNSCWKTEMNLQDQHFQKIYTTFRKILNKVRRHIWVDTPIKKFPCYHRCCMLLECTVCERKMLRHSKEETFLYGFLGCSRCNTDITDCDAKMHLFLLKDLVYEKNMLVGKQLSARRFI